MKFLAKSGITLTNYEHESEQQARLNHSFGITTAIIIVTLITFALFEKEGSVGVTGLETTGVSTQVNPRIVQQLMIP